MGSLFRVEFVSRNERQQLTNKKLLEDWMPPLERYPISSSFFVPNLRTRMEFPSNSHKSDDEPPKVQAVTSAETVQRRSPLGRKFREAFFAGSGREALSYSVEEVFVPTIQDMLIEALQGSIERIIKGDRSVRTRRTSSGPFSNNNVGHVNYNGMSTSPSPRPARISQAARARHNFSDLVIPNYQAANEVLDQMFDIVSQYGEVSVAHLYALTNIEPTHTDMKWGWTSLQGAKPAPDRRSGGYILKLPPPQELHR